MSWGFGPKNPSGQSARRSSNPSSSVQVGAAGLYLHNSSVNSVDSPPTNNPRSNSHSGRAKKPDKQRMKSGVPGPVQPKLASHCKANQGQQWILHNRSDGNDVFADWFEKLGLPHHTQRIRRESESRTPRNPHLTSATSYEPSGSDHRAPVSGLNFQPFPSGVGMTTSVNAGSKALASASSLTSDQIHDLLRWNLFHPMRNTEIVKPQTPYKKVWYDANTTKAIHDIMLSVVRPIDPKSKRPLEIHRKITGRLIEEQHLLSDESNYNPKLHLPNSWNDPVNPVPIFYPIPLGHARYITKISLRIATDDIVDVQSAASVHSDEAEYSQPSLEAMSRDIMMHNPPERRHPTELVNDSDDIKASLGRVSETNYLRTSPLAPPKTASEFHARFSFRDNDPDAEKTKTAYAMFDAAKILNRPWERCRAIEAMKSRISSIDGHDTVIRWISEEEMASKDLQGEIGSTMVNWDTTNPLQFEAFIIEKFLAFPGCPVEASSEGRVEKEVGNLVINIIAGKGFRDRDNCKLQFTGHLAVVGSHPSPDSYVRASAEEEGLPSWPEDLLPVLFAGECKPQKTYNNMQTRVQLATAFHATLILLILFYLDTRTALDATLPSWLFLYGIEYTEHGVIIHAHHPEYHFSSDGSNSGQWWLVATLLSEDYSKAFLQGVDPRVRVRLLATLFRIRKHVIFIRDQLRTWSRARDVLSMLSESTKINVQAKNEKEVGDWREVVTGN